MECLCHLNKKTYQMRMKVVFLLGLVIAVASQPATSKTGSATQARSISQERSTGTHKMLLQFKTYTSISLEFKTFTKWLHSSSLFFIDLIWSQGHFAVGKWALTCCDGIWIIFRINMLGLGVLQQVFCLSCVNVSTHSCYLPSSLLQTLWVNWNLTNVSRLCSFRLWKNPGSH